MIFDEKQDTLRDTLVSILLYHIWNSRCKEEFNSTERPPPTEAANTIWKAMERSISVATTTLLKRQEECRHAHLVGKTDGDTHTRQLATISTRIITLAQRIDKGGD